MFLSSLPVSTAQKKLKHTNQLHNFGGGGGVAATTVYIRILDVLGSNLRRNTPILIFPQSVRVNSGTVPQLGHTASFQIPSNSSFIHQPTIRSYKGLATDSFVGK
jgi:hypothetical protein